MLELDETNAIDYLIARGDIPNLSGAQAKMLGWGVSNVVLRIDRPSGENLVIKQCREKLRTKADWFSRLDRIFREIGMLKLLISILPDGVIPHVLFEDRENYLFGMEAINANHVVWKQHLLEGSLDPTIADRLGTYLAQVHSATADNPDLKQEWGNLDVFDELRLDPFYRYLARMKPQAKPYLEQLVDETMNTSACLVLADFSPKNILVIGQRIVLVDFETGHYGDPAFDLGFFLSHLLLKTTRMSARFNEYAELTTRFWRNYWAGMQAHRNHPQLNPIELLRRTHAHIAGCMWARIDGKSTVDYLSDTDEVDHVRAFCLSLFQHPSASWEETLSRLRDGLPS